jgi:hypothetical protein
MPSSPAAVLSPHQRAAFDLLLTDLDGVFGTRLRSLVAYGLEYANDDAPLRSLAMVGGLGPDDLHRMAPLARGWHRSGLAVPLLLTHHEFTRTIDVFPLEYGNIIASHAVLHGSDPFAGVLVPDADRRRGCEFEAKSHLIHLREGLIETEGDAGRMSRLVAASAPSFRTVLVNILRLERGQDWPPGGRADAGISNDALAAAAEETIGVPASLVIEVLASAASASSAADPSALLGRYVGASERVWRYVDGWRP